MTSIPGAYNLSLHGQTLSLLPQRAIFWREEKILIVADVHLGKAQTFQRAGLAVPGQVLQDDLDRLENLVRITVAQRLLVLGDFVHHRSGLTKFVCQQIERWCRRLNVEVVVVLGNHDRPNRKLLANLPITLYEPAWFCGPFGFVHEAIAGEYFYFVGHLHPVINFRQSLRLPVFAFYRTHCVLPAFSLFTGGSPLNHRGLLQAFIPLEDRGADAGKVVALADIEIAGNR